MKRKSYSALSLLLVALLLFSVASCAAKKDADNLEKSAYFVAKVTEVREKKLFVTIVQKGTSSLAEGNPAYVSTNFEGYTACSVGDYIIVEYDTMVQEMYPPIVPNVFSITKADTNGNPLKQ